MREQRIVLRYIGSGFTRGPAEAESRINSELVEGWRIRAAEPLGGKVATVLFDLRLDREDGNEEQQLVTALVEWPDWDPGTEPETEPEVDCLDEYLSEGWRVDSARPFASAGVGGPEFILKELDPGDPDVSKVRAKVGSFPFLIVLER